MNPKNEIKFYRMSVARVYPLYIQKAPQINPNVSKITGVICGYRVEAIEAKIIQQVRYLDKLIDELEKGKPMETILRK
jgi:hypothetical protein